MDWKLDENWELVITSTGNLQITTDDESIVQEVANQCQLFYGEAWFDRTQGILFFENIFVENINVKVVKNAFRTQALTVDGTTDVIPTLYIKRSTRELGGVLQIITEKGKQVYAGFNL